MPLRIMIVEDEPLIAMGLETVLEDAGHHVVGIAAHTKAALDLAAANLHLDLAIMDVQLARGTDGVETARRLRQEYDVASLFVSANLDDEVRVRAAAWRPVGFIGKPYQEAAIIEALDALRLRPLA